MGKVRTKIIREREEKESNITEDNLEDVRKRKMHAHGKVEKSQNTVFVPMICGFPWTKSTLDIWPDGS